MTLVEIGWEATASSDQVQRTLLRSKRSTPFSWSAPRN
jgi:hypothetical protein